MCSRILTPTSLLLWAALSACLDVDTGDTSVPISAASTAEFCDRMDECDLLQGMSAAECEAQITTCLGGLPTSDADTWRVEIATCLQQAQCSAFGDCYWEVPDC